MNEENSSEGVWTGTGEEGMIGSEAMDPKGDIEKEEASFATATGATGEVCETGPVEMEKISGSLFSTTGATGSVCAAAYCEMENFSGSLTIGATMTGSV
jgi:hypothetical protein